MRFPQPKSLWHQLPGKDGCCFQDMRLANTKAWRVGLPKSPVAAALGMKPVRRRRREQIVASILDSDGPELLKAFF